MRTEIDRSSTVAQIVTDHPSAARVFQRYRLDFCCHGDVPLPQACVDRGLDVEAIAGELAAALAAEDSRDEDPRLMSTPALLAYIVERHHGYLREALPFIAPIASKVARVHGDRNPQLEPLARAFQSLQSLLLPHIDDEEAVLFPLLALPDPDRTWARRELAAMRDEHLAVGRLLADLRRLGDGFSTPEWGCKTYRVLMHELEALEADVLRHVHLENHVLLPRFTATGERS